MIPIMPVLPAQHSQGLNDVVEEVWYGAGLHLNLDRTLI